MGYWKYTRKFLEQSTCPISAEGKYPYSGPVEYGLFRKWTSPHEGLFLLHGFFPWADIGQAVCDNKSFWDLVTEVEQGETTLEVSVRFRRWGWGLWQRNYNRKFWNTPPALYRLRVKPLTESLWGLFRKWKNPYETRFFLCGFFPWADIEQVVC